MTVPIHSSCQQIKVVIAATIFMMCGFGTMTTVGTFMKPLEEEFGWLRADMSFAYTLFTLGTAGGGLVWGHLSDRFDPRPIAIFGSVMMAGGLLLLSRQSNLFNIQLLYLLIGALGLGCLYSPVLSTVGLWFEKRRGLALGIVTAGGTLGQGLIPLAVQEVLEVTGWREAYLLIGCVYCVLLAPAALMLRKPNVEIAGKGTAAARPPGWALPPELSVVLLSIGAILCCLCMAVPLVHLIPYFSDTGRSPASTASLVFVAMLAGTVGRVLFGSLADRIGGLATYALASGGQTVTVYWFVELEWLPSLYVLSALFGFGFSGVMTSLVLCVREAVPARVAGFSTAIVSMFAWLGMGSGGYLGGHCFDITGSYAMSFGGAAGAGVANLLLLGTIALLLRAKGRATGLPAPVALASL